ncbi:All-trans-phytoene synthase [Legionella geestiana]|uniref:All-trans-phytoene synthase n=1 Tax=Legionella geestiana TaxID=45065 RepID=A0A0W0TPH3_9GAMM|nr:phytoene/squalene synthase family protein [Legionella geestiana]KTC97489.1 All-trans-phytoene synthase [Legionella geestiana]QBS13306.1 phytoene/squalene synthase family protein [Legionella geestiana]QDQ40899.1 phytoene/squalene synthase family protein [Legionella geestiana]STX54167.1 Dehydrosqualene synthase [Legionella geestiana]
MNAEAVFQKHAKSFSFAAKWLPRDMRQNAAVLYAFCRYCDDLADNAFTDIEKTEACAKIDAIADELERQCSSNPVVVAMLQLIAEKNVSLLAAQNLVAGVRFDLNPVRIIDRQHLTDYAYKVAGTVGEMMCPILGCTHPSAVKHAISLGIAMQLTNIVRDVDEDARMNRLYLPEEWLEFQDPESLSEPQNREKTQTAMKHTLALAETYYQHAAEGLQYIPGQPRLAIMIALRIYRLIGLKIARKNYPYWLGRVATRPWEKILAATTAGIDYWRGHYQNDLPVL